MSAVKNFARTIRNNWLAARKGMATARLLDLTGHSGLGDSAFLLYGLVRSAKPKVVLEIGSARGRSTCFIGTALKENGSGKLYAVDPHMETAWNDDGSIDTYEVLKANVRQLGLTQVVEILRNTSDEVAKNWTECIDILFIDGDHSYEGAKRDWDLFSPFVTLFGSVIFHDTLWDLRPDPKYARADMGVPRLVEELRIQGYPVITLDRDFGVSLIQPVRNGVGLAPQKTDSAPQYVEIGAR